jgi:hypothetical protein
MGGKIMCAFEMQSEVCEHVFTDMITIVIYTNMWWFILFITHAPSVLICSFHDKSGDFTQVFWPRNLQVVLLHINYLLLVFL